MDAHRGLVLEVAALTDIGCKRLNNEDCFGYDLASEIYIVCDGMGGTSGGEVASAAAVEQLIKSYGHTMPLAEGAAATVEERLYSGIMDANRRVCQLAQADMQLRGMGTTLVAALGIAGPTFCGRVSATRSRWIIRFLRSSSAMGR
jgi:serine/threonine protein phosphatase PrpC